MENKVAKKFGARRSGSLSQGRREATNSDTDHPSLYIECRHRRKPAPVKWFSDIQSMARSERKLPVLVFKHPELRHYLILCKLKDLDKVAKEIVK